jgi:hypothetical protein
VIWNSHGTIVANIIEEWLVSRTTAGALGESTPNFMRCCPDHLRVVADYVEVVAVRAISEVVAF